MSYEWSDFFVNDTATTEIYTLSLHDALPISGDSTVSATTSTGTSRMRISVSAFGRFSGNRRLRLRPGGVVRSEEHTSELQSRQYLVCRLLLEKKKLSRPTHCPPLCSCFIMSA